MTQENLTAIVVILDGSGSMSSLKNDTIGSFNSFLKEQKAFPGEAIFTLCTFNTHHQLVHDFVKMSDVNDLSVATYHTEGGTALFDAIGSTIDNVGQKLAALPEERRPSKVLVLIQTDGEENSSCEYTRDRIKSMVEHQRETYNWEFIFVGANIDAFTAGTSLGISARNSVSYNATKGGTRSLYGAVSANTTSYRSSHSSLAPDFFGQTGITPTSPAAVVPTPTLPITPDTNKNSDTK